MGDAADPAPVPGRERLERLPADEWAVLLRHARAALHRLPDEALTPRMAQLRALPSGRLAGGRSRRDLAALLASGGELWRLVAEGLATDADAAAVTAALRGERDLSRRDAAPPPAAPTGHAETSRDERSRQRAREFREQRDEAVRRADGLEARLRTERARADDLARELEAVTADRDRLAAEVEAAAAEREDALERLRRRYEADLDELREELRGYRHEEQRRRERARRAAESRRAVEQQARHEIRGYRLSRASGRRSAIPGRPSRLPGGVVPGTAEAAATLLHRGRRVFVDGYNVTKTHRGHVDLEQQRNWLLAVAAGLAARTGAEPTVVFDTRDAAAASPRTVPGVRVAFAEGSADDEIVRLVAALPPDEPVAVVTDDRELAERVRTHRADVIPTAAFVEVAD